MKRSFLVFTHWAQRWIIFVTLVFAGGPAWNGGPKKRGLFDNDALSDILAILTALRITRKSTGEDDS